MMTTMSSPTQLRPQAASEATSDAALLARFLATKDDAAFSQIVQRHGPMVLAVCRRILRNSTDAEDMRTHLASGYRTDLPLGEALRLGHSALTRATNGKSTVTPENL